MVESMAQKILAAHTQGMLPPNGKPLDVVIDQTLTQDATGTMAWLQFEALRIGKVQTSLSVSYVDHNTLQTGFRNPDDHRFLRTAAARFGAVFSPPGTGICHQLHLENFAKPGTTLIGSDSHTPTAGGIGALAMGAGGLSVALAMAGQPYTIPMPSVMEIHLTGSLRGWASAKDIILYLLGKLSVKGGVGKILEYTGDGVVGLTVPERATIANMGAELGATASLFPSDEKTLEFLTAQGRAEDWIPLAADPGATYDERIVVDLSELVPLAACPHMPDNVVPVASLDGLEVNQVAIGSCTNSSYRDLSQVAAILQGKNIHPATDVMISPGSKQVLQMLASSGELNCLLNAGVRLLECTCGPCIGMGGSPVSAGVSVRTFNRNFEGRSGTKDAGVYLVSPATAAMVALRGKFTDPAGWGSPKSSKPFPKFLPSIRDLFIQPAGKGEEVEIIRGPNIAPLPAFPELEESLSACVTIKLGDNITTDHIMPAETEVISLRSNIPAIAEHVFSRVDSEFPVRTRSAGNGIILAGHNYGQGSSREHAALAPRYLGIRVVLALSLARIHRANLVNFGILPLTLTNQADYEALSQGVKVHIPVGALEAGKPFILEVEGVGEIVATNDLSHDELMIIKAGGLLNRMSKKEG